MQKIYNLKGQLLYQQDCLKLLRCVEEAVLNGINLKGANLEGADLNGAYFKNANLINTKGLIPERITPLLILFEQPGPIRAYKLVDENFKSPLYHTKLKYRIGDYISTEADTNINKQCGRGINVATLNWILENYRVGYRVLVVEFTAKDIACIPTGTDGKFRLHRCKIVKELDIQPFLYERN